MNYCKEEITKKSEEVDENIANIQTEMRGTTEKMA